MKNIKTFQKYRETFQIASAEQLAVKGSVSSDLKNTLNVER